MSTGKIVGLINALGGSPSGGGGLPTGGEPFKQLVTDADGNTVWADRLAYENETVTPLINVENTGEYIETFSGNFGAWVAAQNDSVRVVCTGTFGTATMDTVFGQYGILFVADAERNIDFYITVDTPGTFRVNYAEGSNKIDGTLTISVIEKAVSTIDPKFLPAIRGTAFYVNVTQTDTDTYTADKTYTEISNAITNGLIPYCVYGNYLLPMVLSNSGALSGIAPAVALNPPEHIFSAIAPLAGNNTQYAIISVKINESDEVSYQYHAYSYDSTSN